MFSKPAKSADALPSAASDSPHSGKKAPPRVASLIGADTSIEGSITGDGDLHIDGSVKGDVRVGRLTIGDTGHIDGGVYAEVVEVRGRVVGSITAKQVRLYGTSYVDGDITHEQLAMETGAFFQGRSLKFQRPPPQPAAAPALAAPTSLPEA